MRNRPQQKITKNELLNLFEKSAGRIDLLAERDKAIVRLFMNSQKFRTLAKSAGISEATIARKLKRIACRIGNNNAITALAQASDNEAGIIRDYFIKGTTIKAISQKTGLSRYRVNKIIRQYKI